MNKVLDVISKIISVVLSVILFALITIYLSLNVTSKIVTKENVATVVKETDIETVLKENNSNMMDELYEIADDNNVDRGVVDGVVNSKEFKELVGNYYGEMIEELLYEGKSAEITSEEIVNAVNDVLDRSANELGYNLSFEQRNNIINQVEEKADKVVKTLPSYEKVTKNLDTKDIEAIRIIFSNDHKTVLIVMMLIIVGIIALIRWSIYRFAMFSGTATVIAGGVFTIIGLLSNFVLSNISPSQISLALNNFIQNNIAGVILHTGIITIVIGIVQIVYYVIMRRVLDKGHSLDY